MLLAILFISVLVAGSLLAWLYIEHRRLNLAIERRKTVLGWPESRLRPVLSERQKLIARWDRCQVQFVEDPIGAVDEADRLTEGLMRDPQYSRIVNTSATQTMHYREAREITAEHRRGEASNEDLKIAFLHFRALLDAMLGTADVELQRAS